MRKGQISSRDNRFRYRLWRIWDEAKPTVLFILHNPSTANDQVDDPTVRRCISFASAWAYGGIHIGNIYPARATKPSDLKQFPRPGGRNNMQHLRSMADQAGLIVCAWGNRLGAPSVSIQRLGRLFYLELSKQGTPKHPLYLRGDLRPQPF